MKTYNILVVDDSATNIILLEAIFNDKRYKISKALNVDEAVQSMSKIMPDLILLDLLMPRISGFEFLEYLKKDHRLKSVPVIVISAATDDERVDRVRQMEAVEFVSKPVDIQNLLILVEKTLHIG